MFTKGSALHLANADGSNPHLLLSINGFPAGARFSSDGSRIRFSIFGEANTQSLWEVGSDGSGLHQLFPGWHSQPAECCGRWTPDGRYYIFQSASGNEINLYALRESTSFFRKATPKPIQLTTGPLLYSTAVPALDGKKLFVEGVQQRGELVRYDSASKQFVPFLGGISATDLAFSRDGAWVTYSTAPEGTLWRSRVNGSEAFSLPIHLGCPLFQLVAGRTPDRLRRRSGRKALENFCDPGAGRLTRRVVARKHAGS